MSGLVEQEGVMPLVRSRSRTKETEPAGRRSVARHDVAPSFVGNSQFRGGSLITQNRVGCTPEGAARVLAGHTRRRGRK